MAWFEGLVRENCSGSYTESEPPVLSSNRTVEIRLGAQICRWRTIESAVCFFHDRKAVGHPFLIASLT
jgi:hypothetical protein